MTVVVLVDAHPRHAWLKRAVPTRLRQELAKLQVEVNEEKSTTVELDRGVSFGFLGFEFRRVRSLSGALRPQYTPKLKRRTALPGKLREIFRRFRSQPVSRVIELINPILRGWVNYFAVGHSSRCLHFIQDWVETKIRRHMSRARNRRGFGWKRWSRRWLYETLGLFNGHRVRRRPPESAPGMIGPITLDAKHAGERSAGKPPAPFDVAGAGNVAGSKYCDTRRRKCGTTGNTNIDLHRRASPRPYSQRGLWKRDDYGSRIEGHRETDGFTTVPYEPPYPTIMCAPHFYPDSRLGRGGFRDAAWPGLKKLDCQSNPVGSIPNQ